MTVKHTYETINDKTRTDIGIDRFKDLVKKREVPTPNTQMAFEINTNETKNKNDITKKINELSDRVRTNYGKFSFSKPIDDTGHGIIFANHVTPSFGKTYARKLFAENPDMTVKAIHTITYPANDNHMIVTTHSVNKKASELSDEDVHTYYDNKTYTHTK